MPSNHFSRRRELYQQDHLQTQFQPRTQLQIDTSLASPSSPTSFRSAKSQNSGPGSARDNAPLGGSSSNKLQQPSPRSLSSASSHNIFHDARHDPDESFLDSQTPVEADMAEQQVSRVLQQRDSHDLSLSPRNVTRDSLVTNMLMSLDQFSIAPANEPQYEDEDDSPRFFDVPRYRSNNDITAQANNRQQRGHAHQYSYSSDLDLPADDESARLSKGYSRGRRSNSSTTPHGNRPPPSRGNHIRGGKNSKSSSLDSSDHGITQVGGSTGQQRPNRPFTRSASFDSGPHQGKQQPYPQLEDVPQSPFRSDFFFLADEIDAAPVPTVHGGPRRTPSTPTSPPPSDFKERSSALRNRSTSRSIKSSSGRSKAALAREPAPPMPEASTVLDLESAPAPNVGYGKPKEQTPTKSVGSVAPAQPKERSGFFKRVFGGGSSKTNSPSPAVEANVPLRINPGNQASDSPSSARTQPPLTQSKGGTAPPSRDTTSSHSNHPTLQKKSSSFFRRRKKSAADQAPPVPSVADAPPVPPVSSIHVEKDKFVPMAEPSPASSLRQAMNPYLHETATGPTTPAQKTSSVLMDITNIPSDSKNTPERGAEYKREFSPDYEPSPNARIRKVESKSDHDLTPQTPSKAPAQTKSGSNTFLDLGTSDNEEQPTPIAKTSTQSRASELKENRQEKSKQEPKDAAPRPRKKKSSKRLPIQTGSGSNLALPLEGAKSGSTTPRSRASTPNLRIDTVPDEPSPNTMDPMKVLKGKSLDEPDFVIGEPTEDDRSKAQKIYEGNEDFIQKEKAAAWMGEEGPVRQRTLQAYMELYDFADQSVVYSLRQICGRLVFRAETQQVDRILVAFSKRWCDCNPNHGFKATDVIHTICYSIMLLNTDLHMADIEQKMTRSQFVKNTMSTIIYAVEEAAPDAFERRPSILTDKNSLLTPDEPPTPTPTEDRKSFRHSFRPPPRNEQENNDAVDVCGPLVKAPFTGTIKGWEEQIEVVLKAIYASIRDERLPLFGADPAKSIPTTPSQSSLSVIGILKRTPSVLSKAPSEGNLSMRGRITESRGTASRWSSKSRSRPGMGRNGFNSSRTSLDDNNSMWSPPLSSSATWSRQSLGRTQGSVSQDSLASHMLRGDYQQSIGFANALSQAITREEDQGDEMAPSILSADISNTQLLEDESLELTGPPWMKEGLVIHKHHLDGVDKKAKERNWTEVFVVLQKGQMSLFSFDSNKSMRQKNRTRAAGPVGGGNWQDNATNVGTFNLRQTLASALPPPGYSRTRPYVWALSLPTGAVHLFQVGTPELIKEFVTTANYWSARLSTHPLMGGISNVEYGWSDAIVNNALVSAINDNSSPPPGRISRPGSAAAHGRKSSVSSFRSASIDHATAAFTNATGRGKLPGDRIHIAEWAPPTQSLRPSNATETEQLEILQAYVKGIEDELQSHNQLRSPMLLAFTPRLHNAGKAMANWERKSAYLLREIVKFRTYVDCLQQAENRKQEIYAERDLAQRAARGELTDVDADLSGGDSDIGDETLRP